MYVMPPMLIVILADRSDFIVASLVGGRLEEALVQYKRSKENGVDRAEVHIRNVRSILILLGINYKNKPDIVSFPGQCKNTWAKNEGGWRVQIKIEHRKAHFANVLLPFLLARYFPPMRATLLPRSIYLTIHVL